VAGLFGGNEKKEKVASGRVKQMHQALTGGLRKTPTSSTFAGDRLGTTGKAER